MQIANPIYDVAFKYLMEDSKVAKLLVSSIIGEEVVSLVLKPQEKTRFIQRASLTVYRLDFSAKIKTPAGIKNVLIEIQKAKFSTDIMRFRRYLGGRYQDEENTTIGLKNKRNRQIGIPIVTIYFLGHELEHYKVPFLKVKRDIIDPVTGESIELTEKEDFIESLTHDSFIIQIPHLPEKRQAEIYQLLSIFDQRNIDSDHHILNVKETDFPPKYRSLIRRLQKAASEPEVREGMEIEDEVLEELEALERIIAEKDQSLTEKDQSLAEQQKNLAEKDQSLAEQQKSLAEKDQSLAEKDRLIEELQNQLK